MPIEIPQDPIVRFRDGHIAVAPLLQRGLRPSMDCCGQADDGKPPVSELNAAFQQVQRAVPSEALRARIALAHASLPLPDGFARHCRHTAAANSGRAVNRSASSP